MERLCVAGEALSMGIVEGNVQRRVWRGKEVGEKKIGVIIAQVSKCEMT